MMISKAVNMNRLSKQVKCNTKWMIVLEVDLLLLSLSLSVCSFSHPLHFLRIKIFFKLCNFMAFCYILVFHSYPNLNLFISNLYASVTLMLLNTL